MPRLKETLTEELLRKLYVEESLTETEIADRFGTYQVKVGRLRKSYGIPTISKGERLGLPELTPRLKSILVGSMLGDGGLQRTGSSTARYVEHHSAKQRTYLDWKAREWGSFVSDICPSDKGDFKGHRLITHGCPTLYPYYQLFYPSGAGAKTFTGMPLDWVDGLALAVWFMDDGSKTANYVRFSIGPSPEDQRMQLRILKALGINGRLYTSQGDSAIHVQGRTHLNRFLELVRPYLHPSMQYKLNIPAPKPGIAPRDLLTPKNLQPFVDSGESLQGIARALGVSRSSVGRAWRRMGAPSRPPGRPPGKTVLTPEASELALHQLNRGADDFPSEALRILQKTLLPEPVFSDEEIQSDWNRLQEAPTELVGGEFVRGTFAGTKLCQRVFPYRWDARYQKNPSVREAWGDPRYLKRAIQFQISVGDPVTPARVLRALQAVVRAPTNFRPCFAKALARTYCPEGGLVLDPCAGYGGRAIGVLSSGRRYMGVDPHPAAKGAFSTLREIVGALEFYHSPFEDVSLGDTQADLILTSPPYFSVERYSEDCRQSWVRYPTWEEWSAGFLGPLVEKSWVHLKPGGYFCLNIKNVRIGRTSVPLADEAVRISLARGFQLAHTLSMPLGRIGNNAQGEPLFVFRRP